MKQALIVFGMGVALASPSVAQSGPVAQKSSEQIVCELTGECGGEAVEATKDAPASRGFSIARSPQPASTTTASRAATTVKAAAQPRSPAVTAPQRAVASQGARRLAPAKIVQASVGRSDLSVSFVSGSTMLTEQAKANVDAFVSALSAPSLSGSRFAIDGHTDSVGGRAFNLDLSKRRAQAVSDYIVAKGVSASRFEVRGYGYDKPRDARNLRSGINRRVEVVKLK